MTPDLPKLPWEPEELVVFWSWIDTLAPASRSPSLGSIAIAAWPSEPTKAACHCTWSEPVFARTTTCACWSSPQPNRTLLGVTCSQPESGLGLVVTVGFGNAVGLLSAPPGRVGPVAPRAANTPTWLSRRRP